MEEKSLVERHLAIFAAYLFITWGFYRLLFVLPDPFDILLLEPVIWLVPIVIFLKNEKKNFSSIGFTSKRTVQSLYFVLVFSTFFLVGGFVLNNLRYKGLGLSGAFTAGEYIVALLLSLVIAFSEEVSFRGYFFNRLKNLLHSEWKAHIVSSGIWTLIYLPLAILDWQLQLPGIGIYILVTFALSVMLSFVFARTKNIAPLIVLHTFWVWPLIIYR